MICLWSVYDLSNDNLQIVVNLIEKKLGGMFKQILLALNQSDSIKNTYRQTLVLWTIYEKIELFFNEANSQIQEYTDQSKFKLWI